MARSGKKNHPKTLIVEDNESFRRSFKEWLQALFPSIIVEEAGDGSEALQKVEIFQPTLVFMDIQLQGENGLKLTKKIKEKHPDILVVIVTNYDIPEYRDAALQYGASGFISKDSLGHEQVEKLIESLTLDG